MISFDIGPNIFHYRVVGVAVHNDCVLLHQAGDKEHWAFPGGRAEFGESAQQALKREMREEINTEVEIVRPLWFVENFFKYGERRYHELSLYFLMRFPGASTFLRLDSFQGKEAGTTLTFRWFPRRPEVLAELPLLPSFLQTAVQRLPESVQHVVHHDE